MTEVVVTDTYSIDMLLSSKCDNMLRLRKLQFSNVVFIGVLQIELITLAGSRGVRNGLSNVSVIIVRATNVFPWARGLVSYRR